MTKGAPRIHLSAFAGDAFDVPGALPFLGDVLRYGQGVTFNANGAVVNDSPAVNHLDPGFGAYMYCDWRSPERPSKDETVKSLTRIRTAPDIPGGQRPGSISAQADRQPWQISNQGKSV